MSNRRHRRIPHPRPWCCHSRLGKAKAVYGTPEEAEAARVWAEKHYKDGPMEVYECRVKPGRWHVRKVRAKREAVAG